MLTIARRKIVKKPVWLFVVLAVAFVGVLFLGAVVRSATATTVTVDPLASTVMVGESTTVDVVVQSVTDLYGVQLRIDFDPTVVQVLDADLGTAGVQIEPGTCPVPDFVVQNEVSNATGIISYTVTALNPSPACNGDGTVASVEFEGLAAGESALQFSDVILANSDGREIAADTQDGTLTVESMKKVFLPLVQKNY